MCTSVAFAHTVVMCSDFALGSSFYAQMNLHLRPQGIALEEIDFSRYGEEENLPPDAIIFFNCPWQGRKLLEYPSLQSRRSLFLWEPPTIYPDLYRADVLDLFQRVYTWNDPLIDNVRCFKFYYPCLQEMIRDVVPFHAKKLCTQVSANKQSPHPDELYSQREEVIRFFESFSQDDFRFYGYGWESSGYRNYGGAVEDKIRTISQYRFNFCYENIKEIEGYVTEKIFDSFTAGCIPIYWGASNIDTYVPRECFIDRRDFDSLEDLYLFLKGMTEHEYDRYIARIRIFLGSEEAKVFRREYFNDLLLREVLLSAADIS